MDVCIDRLRTRLERLFAEIEEVCASCGRASESVECCAISKYATSVETEALVRALASLDKPVVLGERRVQELTQKAAELAGCEIPIQWDFVGSLQRNKARRAFAVFDRIHSLDRESILRHLDELAAERETPVRGFLQVNISDESQKGGFAPEELPGALELAASLRWIQIEGLMGMAPRGTDHESARPAFALLRELRDRHAPALADLSMGMSGDWHGAIREGATVLRIGSALFADDSRTKA